MAVEPPLVAVSFVRKNRPTAAAVAGSLGTVTATPTVFRVTKAAPGSGQTGGFYDLHAWSVPPASADGSGVLLLEATDQNDESWGWQIQLAGEAWSKTVQVPAAPSGAGTITVGGTQYPLVQLTSLATFTYPGGGAGGGSGVDLSNYFTKTESTAALTAAIQDLKDNDRLLQYATDLDLASKKASRQVSRTTAYTAAAGDLVLADVSGGTFAVTLPTLGAGSEITVKKTDSSTNPVTVTLPSGSVTLVYTGEARTFASTGTNYIVSGGLNTLSSLDLRYMLKPDESGAAAGRLPAVTQVNPTGYALTAAPTADGQILIWNDTTKRWVPANTSTITPAAIGAQPASTDLTTIAALSSTTAGAMVTDGGGWIRKSYAQLKTALGLVKGDVGLSNVDNTADTGKPVSTAQQAALDLKAPLASPAFTGTPTGITKTHVGLGNVDNTADTAKPVSTAQQAAIDARGFGFPASLDTAELRGSDTQALPVNRAVWHRVRDGGTITKIALHVAVQSGNISVGAYANSGTGRTAVPGAPLSLSGAVACPAVGYAEIALGGTAVVKPGDWLAISADNVTATFKSGLPGFSLSALGGGRTYYRDTAHPLPSGTPDSLTAITGYPIALVGVA